MNRRRLAEVVTRAYPVDLRTERGAELVGTLLDAGEESLVAFVHQLGSVLRAGLAARVRIALTLAPAQIAIYALTWGAVMVVLGSELDLVGFVIHARGQVVLPAGILVTWVLPALVVLAFIMKRSRTCGLLGIALIVLRLALEPLLMSTTWQVAQLVLPVSGFALLIVAPDRIPSSGRWAVVVPTVAFLCFDVTQIGFYSGVDVIVPVLLALCLLPFQPAFAIGTALAWSVPTLIGFIVASGGGGWPTLALIACTPLSVMTAWIGRHQARRG